MRWRSAVKPRLKPHPHTVSDVVRCFHQRVITGVPRFFPPKLNYREVSPLLHRWDLCQRHVCLSSRGTKIGKGAGEGRGGKGTWGKRCGDSKNGGRRTYGARCNSRANFEGPFFPRRGERRRQPKITPLGPPSRTAADQSPGHGLIESRQSPLVGLIAPHHFHTSERSTSLLRDFYPDALARRAVPRHVLNWRV